MYSNLLKFKGLIFTTKLGNSRYVACTLLCAFKSCGSI